MSTDEVNLSWSQYGRLGDLPAENETEALRAEITALRAENARLAQWTDNAQERFFRSLEKVDALRAALDQERAWRQKALPWLEFARRSSEFRSDTPPPETLFALLSGRGEGGG